MRLAARRRQARSRPGADGRARAGRDRRARARQRPLPDELLGDEGLRRGRLPARGGADAPLPRGVGATTPRGRRGRPTCGSSPATTRPTRARRRRGRSSARPALAARARTVGLELSLGTQASDRMVGEPTTYTKALVRRLPGRGRRDAAARRGAREQDRAGDRADAARERDRRGGDGPRARRDPAGQTEAQIAAEWLGFVHGEGTGWAGQGRARARLLARLGGPRDQDVHRDLDRPVVEGEPTLFEIWVCADGYWADHTKNLVVGELTDAYRELEARAARRSTTTRVAFCVPGASLAELDRRIREGIARIGYPGQPTHPICHGVGARAHEPPYAHQAGGGEVEPGMVLAIEPGCYWPERRRPAPRGQLPRHRRRAPRS